MRGKVIIFIVLCMLMLNGQHSPVQSDGMPELWQEIPTGSTVYAEIVTTPDAIYRQEVPNSPPEQWLREENPLLFNEAINVSARHLYLDVEHVLRITVRSDGWGLIEPDNGRSPYLPAQTEYQPTYIRLDYLRPLSSSDFAPFSVYADTQPVDKLVVVIRDTNPRLVLFEGNKPVLHVPIVLGPARSGDYRVYSTRATDDMTGIPAVPFSNYFSGGFSIHGAPWWNWRELVHGYYGSHGCVNLPDREWHQLNMDGQQISVAQWVYRWLSTNIDYDENDPTVEQSQIRTSTPGWYAGSSSVRVIITDSIDNLWQYPVTSRLGSGAKTAQVTDWQPLVDAYHTIQYNWLLMHEYEDNPGYYRQMVPMGQSIAQFQNDTDSDTWILLECTDTSTFNQPAYPGSSRTVGDVCHHLVVERQNSVCTPERVDVDYFGQKVLCNAPRFNYLHLEVRGALIEHERIHLVQFGGYYKTLHLAGVLIDDPTPTGPDAYQSSTIGISELMAQRAAGDDILSDDYDFVLVRPNNEGGVTPVHWRASDETAWNHLHFECGDPAGTDEVLDNLLTAGLMGDAEAYQQLEEICSLPPHQLVPDRWRSH